MSGLNAALLAAEAHRERRRLTALATPAVGLIALICIVPVCWLFWLSFFDADGFTLSNYHRMIENPAYLKIFQTTFSAAALITMLAMLIGFPLSYYIYILPNRMATFCLGLVLLPFWTSLLVRTYAWLVLLQRRGLVNDALIAMGLIKEPLRLAYNWSGTVVGMLHIVLPFFILPMYAAMKSVNTDWLRAAASLGASPARVFWTVFVPLTAPGLVAGLLLVFVYCLGFYVTPEILGGGRVTMVAMKVQQNATIYTDWGAASSLALVLLVVTLVLFFGITKLLGNQRRFGVS